MTVTFGMGSKSGEGPTDKAPGDQIDENLKRIYDELLDEGVPDRFTDLLRKLRDQEGRQ